jgi:dipeptidyl aminopeptidase/acylaminoacyl peptidase
MRAQYVWCRIALVSSVPGPRDGRRHRAIRSSSHATFDWSPNGDEIAFVSKMETLLERSAIRHVANAHTPTLLMHGENDNDVPIAEAEQFYIGLRDVGTEAVMVRYPREGHGIREIEARRGQP